MTKKREIQSKSGRICRHQVIPLDLHRQAQHTMKLCTTFVSTDPQTDFYQFSE